MKSLLSFFTVFFYLQLQAQLPPTNPAPTNAQEAGSNSNSAPSPGTGPVGAPLFEAPKSAPQMMDQSLIVPETFGLSRRDPFKLPEYLIIKLRQKNAFTAPGADEAIDAIRRWPLGSYQLVGIIWDVKRPKAMFMDRMNSIHMLQVNDFIGNAKGVVVAIQSGAVTVLEGKIPQIIKLKK